MMKFLKQLVAKPKVTEDHYFDGWVWDSFCVQCRKPVWVHPVRPATETEG